MVRNLGTVPRWGAWLFLQPQSGVQVVTDLSGRYLSGDVVLICVAKLELNLLNWIFIIAPVVAHLIEVGLHDSEFDMRGIH